MSHPSPNPEQQERELSLRRELEALGEEPPSDDELALLERELDDDAEVATVARLVELAAASTPIDPLSELELHRTWRTVEQRAAAKKMPTPATTRPRRWWIGALGGLAVAAGVLFIVIGPERDEASDGNPSPTHEQIVEMRERVGGALDALDDGKSDSERAVELAAEYQRRLAQRQEQDG